MLRAVTRWFVDVLMLIQFVQTDVGVAELFTDDHLVLGIHAWLNMSNHR